MATKREIENAAMSGAVSGKDLLTSKRGSRGSVLVLRHTWRDTDDGRVLAAIRKAYMAYARERAARLGETVEIYARDGSLLEVLP